MVFALPIAALLAGVGLYFDRRLGFDVFMVFVSGFGLAYVILNLLQAEKARGDMARVLLARNSLWVQQSISDFERIALADLFRARVLVSEGVVRKRIIRLDCLMPGGGMRQVEFVPHARYVFDSRDRNPLCEELLRLAEEARARRHATVDADPELLLDLRAATLPAAEEVPEELRSCRETPDHERSSAETRQGADFDGERLSETDDYMRRWYPLHWLWSPAVCLLAAVAMMPGSPERGWSILGVGGIMLVFQFDLFRRASMGLVDAVTLDGDVLRYRRHGRPRCLALADVIETRSYWTRYYLGRTPITVRYIDGDGARIQDIRFIARRDRGWDRLFGMGEAMGILETNLQRIREKRDPA